MRRWKVYKDSENGEWQWVQWVAVPAREDWGEEPQVHRFSEWHMAMEYANREARTASITTEDLSGEFCDLTATVNDRNHIHFKAGDYTFALARHAWEPLARFLLDVANHTEEE